MTTPLIRFGSTDALLCELRWGDAQSGTAAEVTRGTLRVEVGDTCLWYGDRTDEGMEWTWIELLEFLGHQWPALTHEQALPLGLRGSTDNLHRHANARWEGMPAAVSAREERAVRTFTFAHELSTALQGLWTRPIWILRRGRLCEVASAGKVWLLPAPAVFDALESLGNEIASRAALSGDARAASAVEKCSTRTDLPLEALVRNATSWPQEYIDELGGAQNVSNLLQFSAAAGDSPLLAAARMAGPGLPPGDQRVIAAPIAKTRPAPSGNLAYWTSALAGHHEIGNPWRAFEVGYAAAATLRGLLNMPLDRLDPERFLGELGVLIEDCTLESANVDAIAVWGPKHGPAVFINRAGTHAKDDKGRRTTLAHELCHLLLDREGALPLAEVLGGAAPPGVERRARAFAAEFLVPKAAVARVWSAATSCERAFETLCDQYAASAELVAWQIRNTIAERTAEQTAFLRRYVSQPARF